MLDTKFGLLFLIISATDAYLNDCPTDCLRESTAPERIHLQYGDTFFQEDDIGEEIYASYDMPKRFGSVQPTFGVSLTTDNDLWVGAGGKWSTERISDSPFFVEVSLMPGIYFSDDGPDLGFPVQFRGSLGAGINFGDVGSLSVFYDHRSNAHASKVNPGIETLGIRLTYQLE